MKIKYTYLICYNYFITKWLPSDCEVSTYKKITRAMEIVNLIKDRHPNAVNIAITNLVFLHKENQPQAGE